jgi:hypothetical protein
MKIETSIVEKMTIRDCPDRLDTINVYFEDFGPGQGKVNIDVYGDAWSYYWCAMGKDYTVKRFFLKASLSYIISKLSTGISSDITDESADALDKGIRSEILKLRFQKELTEEEARDLWDRCWSIDDGALRNEELLQDVFGDEWYYCLPTKENPKYLYLEKIVKTIKKALKESEK